MVKRQGNLWADVCSMENIKLAYTNARKGKTHRIDVLKMDRDPMPYLIRIREMLISHTFKSSEYRMFVIRENGKERNVADLPFFPDRIVHWALMQVIEPIIMRNLIDQTYAALPGRGSHQALGKLKDYLKNDDAEYCLKMDIRKFFPSIDKGVLMRKLGRRIKDEDVLRLCSKIIHEYPHPGLPIGNYTSQFFANFYLSDLDHYMKESYHCKYYLRYMDDIIILGWSKRWLHRARRRIASIIGPWGLEIKGSWQVFPIDDRGVDFVGYRTFKRFCLLRKRTKVRMIRAMDRLHDKLAGGAKLDCHDLGCLSSYRGCLMHCDGWRLGLKTVYRIDRKRMVVS